MSQGNAFTQTSSGFDPYAILNVPRNADATELRKAYTTGSRTFHPDKQKVIDYKAAEDAFLTIKNAYDILSDPKLRAAYDEFGMEGVNFLRNKASQSSRDLMEYLEMSDASIDDQNRPKFREALKCSMEYDRFQYEMNRCPSSGKIQVSCTADPFLNRRSNNPLEMDNFLIHFNVGAPASAAIGGKTSMNFGGYSMVKNGIGDVAAQVHVEHEVVPGTDIGVSIDTGNFTKIEVNTSRKMAGGTFVSAVANLGVGGHAPSLVLASQRMLFHDKMFGNFSVSTDQKLNFTTTYLENKLPLYRLAFAMHPGDTSLDFISDHNFNEGHSGKLAIGFALSGLHLKTVVTRTLSRFSTFGVGIKLHSKEGVSWIFQLQRGSFSFNIPITLCLSIDPWLTLVTSVSSIIIDEMVGGFVKQANKKLVGSLSSSHQSDNGSYQQRYNEYHKLMNDAKVQTMLMSKQATSKRKFEEEKSGLVILKGTYQAVGGDNLDVTKQLQFWVVDSKLKLPPVSKSCMLGFYDVSGKLKLDLDKEKPSQTSIKDILLELFFGRASSRRKVEEIPVPSLTIRFQFGDSVYEIMKSDLDEVVLPHPSATKIGKRGIVS